MLAKGSDDRLNTADWIGDKVIPLNSEFQEKVGKWNNKPFFFPGPS
jgi:hypothetical protein